MYGRRVRRLLHFPAPEHVRLHEFRNSSPPFEVSADFLGIQGSIPYLCGDHPQVNKAPQIQIHTVSLIHCCS